MNPVTIQSYLDKRARENALLREAAAERVAARAKRDAAWETVKAETARMSRAEKDDWFRLQRIPEVKKRTVEVRQAVADIPAPPDKALIAFVYVEDDQGVMQRSLCPSEAGLAKLKEECEQNNRRLEVKMERRPGSTRTYT